VDGTTPELCARCGFDSQQWRRRDVQSLHGALGYWWRLATADIGATELNRRPADDVWSVLEYGLHIATAAALLRQDIETLHERPGFRFSEVDFLGSIDSHDHLDLDPTAVLDDLQREGEALAAVAGRQSAAWHHMGEWPGGIVVQAEAILFHAAHDASHHFMDVGEGLGRIGVGAPAARGQIVQINTSDGGVPKRPTPEAEITWDGLEGDRQADGKHHGRAFQAVSLWSAEAIAELAAAGHPIEAGSAGENLTISGIEWGSLRPATRIRAGSALLELSFPAVPCHKQRRWFRDEDISRISHDLNPHLARWYAWVREPGLVRPGDAVVVRP
jgi:MOSC domain-containing protein YiiM